jgi:hypothetical protein
MGQSIVRFINGSSIVNVFVSHSWQKRVFPS